MVHPSGRIPILPLVRTCQGCTNRFIVNPTGLQYRSTICLDRFGSTRYGLSLLDESMSHKLLITIGIVIGAASGTVMRFIQESSLMAVSLPDQSAPILGGTNHTVKGSIRIVVRLQMKIQVISRDKNLLTNATLKPVLLLDLGFSSGFDCGRGISGVEPVVAAGR